MTQARFMYELMLAAESFPDEVKFEMVNDYNRYFAEQLGAGRSEEDITASLPSPSEVAESYRSGSPYLPDGSGSDAAKGSVTALGAFLFVLLIPVLIVYEALAFVGAAVSAVVLLALCIAAAFAGVACFGMSALSRGFILLGIGGLLVTVALVLLSVAAFKGIAAWFAWFPRFMGRVLRTKKGGAA